MKSNKLHSALLGAAALSAAMTAPLSTPRKEKKEKLAINASTRRLDRPNVRRRDGHICGLPGCGHNPKKRRTRVSSKTSHHFKGFMKREKRRNERKQLKAAREIRRVERLTQSLATTKRVLAG